MSDYMDTAEVAKLIRKELKSAFPSVKFSVRISRYAGGSSVNAEWTDGPTVERVEAIIKKYQGSTYDHYSDCWVPAHNELNGKPVSFGADHVFAQRKFSRAFFTAMVERTCAKWYGLPEFNDSMIKETGGQYANPFVDPDPFIKEQNHYLSQLIYQECQKYNADWLPVEVDSTDCDWHEYDPWQPFDFIVYEPEPVEKKPILSDTTDWPAFDIDIQPGVIDYGRAWSDSGYTKSYGLYEAYKGQPVQDGQHHYTALYPAYVCALCNAVLTENIVHSEGRQFCDSCYDKMTAYQQKLERRYERLQNAAARIDAEGQADYNRAHKMAEIIPFGQPILVGHYSERSDRRYRDRIHNTYGRAFDKMNRAKELQHRAEHPSRAISSDDPAAVLKLKEKLDKMKTHQEYMKRVNSMIRSLNQMPLSVEQKIQRLTADFKSMGETKAVQLLKGDFLGRIGFADYELRNNGAEIRRLEGRIKELQAKANKPVEAQTTYGDITITRDTEENRLRIHFPGKPAATIIFMLKQHGFRWSPSNMAWQRQLSADAEYWAKWIIEKVS